MVFRIIIVSIFSIIISLSFEVLFLYKYTKSLNDKFMKGILIDIKQRFYDEVWYRYDPIFDFLDDYDSIFLLNTKELLYDINFFVDRYSLNQITIFTRKNDIIYSYDDSFLYDHLYSMKDKKYDDYFGILGKDNYYYRDLLSTHTAVDDMDSFIEIYKQNSYQNFHFKYFIYVIIANIFIFIAMIYFIIRIKNKDKDYHALYERYNHIHENTNKEADNSLYFANLSHELRTPLNSIIGFSDLIIENNNVTDEIKSYANDIVSSGEYLLKMINHMIDFYRIEEDRIAKNYELFNVNDLVKSCIKVVNIGSKDISISFDEYDSDINVYLNKVLLQQVLINLINNSVKYINKVQGKIDIIISKIQDSSKFMLEIADNGMGIKDSDIKIAMSLFGKLNNKYEDDTHSLGLGLPLCKKIIENMAGDFIICGNYGKGVNVKIILPLNDGIENNDKIS
ncbi:HAMP domain-containing histidine kinase [Anaplasmataceae bacterium AB001_6]|nr:HAMP domain-containing histidine kinase [Anaplasmataceae bacterium AB001_6]